MVPPMLVPARSRPTRLRAQAAGLLGALSLLLLAASPVSASIPSAPKVATPRHGVYCWGHQAFCVSALQTAGNPTSWVLGGAGDKRLIGKLRVCVTPPDGSARTCLQRHLEREGKNHVAAVTWAKKYPDRGPGQYLASFAYKGKRFGPVMAFTR
jgi:hypothetical protein